MKTEIAEGVTSKNTLENLTRILFEQNDQSLSIVENDRNTPKQSQSLIRKAIIHFYFCVEGNAVFEFGPHYSREIQGQRNYFFYNPEKDLSFTLKLSPNTRMVFLTISLESLHQLFVHEPLP